MKRAGYLVLMLACMCLVFCASVYGEVIEPAEMISGEQIAEDTGCSTKEELLDFLKSDAGGEIRLSGDIIWDYDYNDLPPVTKPVTVEMGEYKIHIPSGCFMQLEGPVAFCGEGEVMFEVDGMLNLSQGAEVRATRENAVAIQCAEDANIQLYICNIVASGANSTAIQSANPINPQLCNIAGTRAAIEAPEIILDACTVSPMPEEAAAIERIPTVERGLRLYGITVPADSSPEEYREKIYGYGKLQYAFIDPLTGSAIGGPLKCEWSEVPDWPAGAGGYTLCVKPVQLPDWFPVEIPSFDIPLNIVEKDVPWLEVVYADPYFGMLALQFAPNTPDEEGQVRLFYSTDKGQSWRDVTEDFPDANVQTSFIDIVGLEPDRNYWFYAEVTGESLTGSSNIIYHPNYINDMDIDFSHGGGDRDEDDFGDQGEKPPAGEIIPPADETVPPTDEIAPPVDETVPPTGETTPTISETTQSTEEIIPPSGDTTPPIKETTHHAEETLLPSAVVSETEAEQEPERFEPSTQDSTETTEDGSDNTLNMLDTVIIILSLAVTVGIVSMILLWWKGGRK